MERIGLDFQSSPKQNPAISDRNDKMFGHKLTFLGGGFRTPSNAKGIPGFGNPYPELDGLIVDG